MSMLSVLTCLSLIALGLINASSAAGEAKFYQLKKGNFSVKFTNWGASIVSLILPDKHGKLADVVLGYDSAEDYKNNTPNFGATVGRVANRIKNAEFFLNGTLHNLIPNDGKNTLHGGPKGFGHLAWKMKRLTNYGNKPYIIFSYSSPNGDQGFPGKVSVTVKYMLVEAYSLSITMTGKVGDDATPLNIAHHSYWNLAGHNSGDILDNVVQIFGSKITLLDNELIPTGTIQSVTGTPYDFLKPHSIRSQISKLPKGYDINYVVDNANNNNDEDNMKTAAVAYDKGSGRVMEVAANQPGVQFYTSNTLKDVVGKGGFVYQPYGGLCLESQGFPDAVHHKNFPSIIVPPGKVYKHLMLFKFSTMDGGQ